jgi:hypothetical protein
LKGALKEQADLQWNLREELKANVPKKDWNELLTWNGQLVPSGDEKVLDRLVDVMMFGALNKCANCNGGQLTFRYVSRAQAGTRILPVRHIRRTCALGISASGQSATIKQKHHCAHRSSCPTNLPNATNIWHRLYLTQAVNASTILLWWSVCTPRPRYRHRITPMGAQRKVRVSKFGVHISLQNLRSH